MGVSGRDGEISGHGPVLQTHHDWLGSSAPNRTCGSVACSLIDVTVPWLIAMVLGVCTCFTGVFILITSSYLSDLRFGTCKGAPLADRNVCCGGTDNINSATDECIKPAIVLNGTSIHGELEWVDWDDIMGAPFVVHLAISVTFSALAAYIVHAYAPVAKGSGIPDVKASVSGFSVSRSFSAVCLLVKALGLSLVVGAGLALGKEGPLIQIGVCWAYVLRTAGGPVGALAESVPLYEMVCVGAAAGVSTAFGAPVGGVLFAVEELGSIRTLGQRALLLSFAGSFAASFTLKSWNLNGSNHLTFFALSTSTNSPSKEWHPWEIVIFLLLGVLGGGLGSLFIRLNMAVARMRRKRAEMGRVWLVPNIIQDAICSRLPRVIGRRILVQSASNSVPDASESYTASGSQSTPGQLNLGTLRVLEVIIIAVLTTSSNYPFTPLLKMPMVQVINGLFETCPHSLGVNLGLCDTTDSHQFQMGASLEVSLFFAALVRFAQTVVTFGSPIPSGLFIPSLYMGAALGRLVGLWTVSLNWQLSKLQKTNLVNPSVFAMVGAVAMLSGFARMTVSLVVIMLELTGEVNYAVPFMCAVLTAKLVGDFFTVSIYDGHAALLGFAIIEEPKTLRLEARVADIAAPCRDHDLLDASAPTLLGFLRSSLVRNAPQSNGLSSGGELSSAEGFSSNRTDGLDLPAVVSSPTTLREVSGAAPNAEEAFTPPLDPAPAQGRPASRMVLTPERESDLEVLVLTKGPSSRHVYGVVDKAELRQWLVGQSDAPDSALCVLVGNDSELQSGDGERLLDARGLVDAGIRRLHASAPVLTAVCAFREYPSLRYCICLKELENDSCPASRCGASMGVLSRDRLEHALTRGQFAPAFRSGSHSHSP